MTFSLAEKLEISEFKSENMSRDDLRLLLDTSVAISLKRIADSLDNLGPTLRTLQYDLLSR